MSNVSARCYFAFAPVLSPGAVPACPSAKDSFSPFFSGDLSCVRTMGPTPSISASLSLLAISLVQLLHRLMFQQGTRDSCSRSLPREVVGSMENPYTYSILLNCTSVRVVQEGRLSELKISLAAKKQSEPPKKRVCLKQLHPQVPSCPTGVCEPALGSRVLWNSPRLPPLLRVAERFFYADSTFLLLCVPGWVWLSTSTPRPPAPSCPQQVLPVDGVLDVYTLLSQFHQ